MRFDCRFSYYPAPVDDELYLHPQEIHVMCMVDVSTPRLAGRIAVNRLGIGRIEDAGASVYEVCDCDLYDWVKATCLSQIQNRALPCSQSLTSTITSIDHCASNPSLFSLRPRPSTSPRIAYWQGNWQRSSSCDLMDRLWSFEARQKQQLLAILLKGAITAGFPPQLWTTRRVAQVVCEKLGVEYHPDHLGRILHDLGFSCQKPERQAREQDEAAVDSWRAEAWPRIRKGAKKRS